MSTPVQQQPSPVLFFQTINAYQQTEALKAGIELELFTAIAEGNTTSAQLATRCNASEKGIRVLSDYLTIMGLLTKSDGEYACTFDTSVFLDKRSPAYLGGVTGFLCHPMLTENAKTIASAVRRGGTMMEGDGSVSHENPAWVDFARAMAPLMSMPAQLMAKLVDTQGDQKIRILDVAAGHGLFGLAFAANNPNVEITAVDWEPVLAVARENAAKAGVTDRYTTIPGSAFEVDFGTGYDLVLLTNFLHHFDPATNEVLLKKVHGALADGGKAVILEFVPNDDRVTPQETAGFSLIMLISTPAGDAYTFKELESMASNAGFSRSTLHALPPTNQQVVISEK